MSWPQGVQISFGDQVSPTWESGGCSALNLDAALWRQLKLPGAGAGGCVWGVFIPLEA